MSRRIADEHPAPLRSRSMVQLFTHAPADDADTNNAVFFPSTDEPDLQRLLEEDEVGEEWSHDRPRKWKYLSSSIFGRRTQRMRPLGGSSAGICYACEKLMPKRRKVLRTLALWCFATILSLVVGGMLGLFMLAFFSDDIHHILKVWGKPGQVGDGLSSWPTDFSRDINPIPCHSHNDYWRLVPLYSAIGAGCIGVEADVWLFEEELYVGHSIASLTRNRTLNSLYIQPLLSILSKQNPTTPFHDGRYSLNGVFDTKPEQSLVLLIDFKTPGVDLWPYVLKALDPLRERRFLTHFDGEVVVQRPITVVGTGNTPFGLVSSKTSNPYLDVFFDAPIQTMTEASESGMATDLETHDSGRHGLPAEAQDLASIASTAAAGFYNTSNSYYASGSFNAIFGHLVDNEFSPKQMKLLRDQIQGAHRRGLKARYWELPYWPISLRNYVWEVLVREGVDLLNVDDLKGATERDWRLPHPWW